MSARSGSRISRSGSRRTFSSAPRRCGRSAWARRRPPSRQRSSRGTQTCSPASSSQALTDAESAADDGAGESITRLRLTCREGIVDRELTEREDELENALLAARVPWDADELPLRAAQARLAVEPDYPRRDALGAAVVEVSAAFNDERRDLFQDRNALEAEVSGIADPIAATRTRRASRCARSSTRSTARASRAPPRSRRSASAGSTGCSDPNERRRPQARTWRGCAGSRRSRRPTRRSAACRCAWPPCAASASTSRRNGASALDLEDRPQKSPRACVIASDPPRVVHLITRAQGGLSDYEAFLHEAGHALHYAGCDASLPLAFRRLAAITRSRRSTRSCSTRSPASQDGTRRISASPTRRPRRTPTRLASRTRSSSVATRRSSATSSSSGARFATDGGTPEGYAERLTAATGVRYPAANYLSDMDAGFYSADYLRAWIRSAQLRAYLRREVGEDWWRNEARARASATCSGRGRGRRRTRLPRGSASSRSIRRRSSPSSPDPEFPHLALALVERTRAARS